MKRAAVYLRVSSKSGRQDEANQEPDCVRLCEARGWAPIVFRERESGAKVRPEWRAMLDKCRRGEFSAVVFWSLDRTGRNRVQIAHDIGELFRWGVDVTSVKDAWLDVPAGPLRDLLVQLMGWVAEGERSRLIERTKAGLDRARLMGKKLGRRPVWSEQAQERARELWRMPAGCAPGDIARRLKAEGLADVQPQTIRSFLLRRGAL